MSKKKKVHILIKKCKQKDLITVISEITDHKSPQQIIIMKQLEILQELPNCNSETWNEQMLLKNYCKDLFDTGLSQMFNWIKKWNVWEVQWNRVQ